MTRFTHAVSTFRLARGGRLGWDTYLLSDAETRPRSDTTYTIHTLH